MTEGLAVFTGSQRKDDQGRSLLRAYATPEVLSLCIVAKDEQVALLNSLLAQTGETTLNKLPANAPTAMGRCDDNVVNETAAAVMAAQDSANDDVALDRNEAQARVSLQVLRYSCRRIGVA